jgi:hypothetical protein
MVFRSNQLDEPFSMAEAQWKLEKLYVDLALAKGKALSPLEKKFLRGMLCGYSPAEIAKKVYQKNDSKTVRVYFSNGLYRYIELMLNVQTKNQIKIKYWSCVIYLLEKAGYKINSND